jgi:hypothetical protein
MIGTIIRIAAVRQELIFKSLLWYMSLDFIKVETNLRFESQMWNPYDGIDSKIYVIA